MCASGQKMADLLQKVEQKVYPVANKIVLLIGTNDILQVGFIWKARVAFSDQWRQNWVFMFINLIFMDPCIVV